MRALQTLLELNFHASDELACQPFPLDYYRQNVDRVKWEKAVKNRNLPYEFFAEHMPKEFWSTYPFQNMQQVREQDFEVRIRYYMTPSMVYTSEEVEKLVEEKNWERLIVCQNLPDEFFFSFFSFFSQDDWDIYLSNRKLNQEQTDTYGFYFAGFLFDYLPNHPVPPSLPLNDENVEYVATHPDQTMEFLREHRFGVLPYMAGIARFEPLLEEIYQEFPDRYPWEEFGYPLRASPEFLDRHPELIGDIFDRKDLPTWFLAKHKEKIRFSLFSRPDFETLAWLKENRRLVYQESPWVPTIELECTPQTEQIGYTIERVFKSNIKKTLFALSL